MAINKDYTSARFETETFGIKVVEAIKIFGFDLMLFAMTLIAVKLYSYLGYNAILWGVLAISGSSLLSYCLVPTDRPNMIISCKRNLFLYVGAMIGGYFIIQKLNGIDATQLGVSMGLSAGQTQSNAAVGWLTTIIPFTMIGTPIGLVGYEVKRIGQFYGFGNGRVTKRKRMEQLQRTIVK